MMHFFKSSNIHLDCFTHRKDVIEYAPVVKGIEKIPDWWKSLPKSYIKKDSFYPKSTMKSCVGMYEYYSKSVAIPLWSDLSINVSGQSQYSWQYSDGMSTAEVHPAEEYKGLDLNGYHHLKLISPWQFTTKKDINWLATCPIYSTYNKNDFVFAQGLLNFSKQYSTNLQLFLNTQTPRTFLIPFNTIFLLTPISEAKVIVHRHLVSVEEYIRLTQKSTSNTFFGKYQTHNRIQKCPYKDETK